MEAIKISTATETAVLPTNARENLAGTSFSKMTDAVGEISMPPRTALIANLLAVSSTHNEIQSCMSDEDRSSLITAKEKLSAGLNDVEARLARLRAELDANVAEHAVMTRDLQDIRRILNPVHALPTEILQAIFLLILHLDEDSEETPSFSEDSLDITKAPWTFTHVCRHWRSAAIGCPSLWTSLGLNLRDSSQGTTFEPFASLLDLQVTRSGHRRLIVSLRGLGWSTVEIDSRLLQILSVSAERWLILQIDLDDRMASHLYPLGHFLSCLQVLHLRLECKEDVAFPNEAFSIFAGVPALREVRGSPEQIRCFRLPWGRIRSIILKPPGSREEGLFVSPRIFSNHRAFLSKVIHVESLHVAILPPTGARLGEPLVFQALKQLKIIRHTALSTESNTTALLNDITAPNLTHLHIELSQMPMPIDAIVDFLTRSKCHLKSCRLTFVKHIFRLPTCDIAPIFNMCDQLEDLRLDRFKFVLPATEPDSYPGFITRLCTDPNFLPSLKVLIGSVDTMKAIAPSEQAELLEARPTLRLEEVHPSPPRRTYTPAEFRSLIGARRLNEESVSLES